LLKLNENRTSPKSTKNADTIYRNLEKLRQKHSSKHKAHTDAQNSPNKVKNTVVNYNPKYLHTEQTDSFSKNSSNELINYLHSTKMTPEKHIITQTDDSKKQSMLQGGLVDGQPEHKATEHEYSDYIESEEIYVNLSERGNKADSDNGSEKDNKNGQEEEKVNYRGRGVAVDDIKLPQEFHRDHGVEITPEMFQIEKSLGKGAFGKVFLVIKKDNGKKYAMKVLSKSEIIKNKITKYAVAEKNIMSKIKHPFIVG